MIYTIYHHFCHVLIVIFNVYVHLLSEPQFQLWILFPLPLCHHLSYLTFNYLIVSPSLIASSVMSLVIFAQAFTLFSCLIFVLHVFHYHISRLSPYLFITISYNVFHLHLQCILPFYLISITLLYHVYHHFTSCLSPFYLMSITSSLMSFTIDVHACHKFLSYQLLFLMFIALIFFYKNFLSRLSPFTITYICIFCHVSHHFLS